MITHPLEKVLANIKPGMEIYIWLRSGVDAHTSMRITPEQASDWAKRVAADKGNETDGKVPCFLAPLDMFLGNHPTYDKNSFA